MLKADPPGSFYRTILTTILFGWILKLFFIAVEINQRKKLGKSVERLLQKKKRLT